MFHKDDLIHSYSRKQAIKDGVLVDVTATAVEAAIRYPTAVPAAVWERSGKRPDGVGRQDERGRLWDIIWLRRVAILHDEASDTLPFELHVRNDNHRPVPVTLKAVCGPDDDGNPCITILLPDED